MNVTLPSRSWAFAFDDLSLALISLHIVMAGPVPAIHVVQHAKNDVDARDKPGHDGVTNAQDHLSEQLLIAICDNLPCRRARHDLRII
jgi:hypothetical protein